MDCQAEFVLQHEGKSMNWLAIVELGIFEISTAMISTAFFVFLNVKGSWSGQV